MMVQLLTILAFWVVAGFAWWSLMAGLALRFEPVSLFTPSVAH